MPKKYEAIRDKFEKEGMSEKEAEGHAARIFNATRKEGQKPVTGNAEKSLIVQDLTRGGPKVTPL